MTTVGQLHKSIEVFKGPRLKSENIIQEYGVSVAEPYFTPSAILQDKKESVKYVNISVASPQQKRTIDAIRVQSGDILITRSGSIGRVAIISKHFHGAIVSDDMIRVRVEDEFWRYYLYQFFQSRSAQDQFTRNEYGAVQQHLEPNHVREMLIPVPEEKKQIEGLISKIMVSIKLREDTFEKTEEASHSMNKTLSDLIGTPCRE